MLFRSPNVLHDHKHILKRHIGLFAKNLKDAIHGRVQRRTSQNHPASSQGRSPPLRHASYSNVIKTTPPHTYQWPHDLQTRPQAMPLNKPTTAATNNLYAESNALTRCKCKISTDTPRYPHPAAPHQYPNAPHQTLPHIGKMETACEETHPPSGETNTIPQEIISFLRFVKSFV